MSDLPLKGAQERHTFKLLAGPRWSPIPPTDAGISPEESQSEDGFIKISCEDFPQPGMNLKWISDVLDRLVLEANVCLSHCPTVCLADILLVRKGLQEICPYTFGY